MKWFTIESETDLMQIDEKSEQNPVVIFKHSTRCSISAMAKSRLERDAAPEGVDFYLLDLIKFRSLSNLIAEKYAVQHESPQVLLIKNKACIYDESHNGIRMEELFEQVA